MYLYIYIANFLSFSTFLFLEIVSQFSFSEINHKLQRSMIKLRKKPMAEYYVVIYHFPKSVGEMCLSACSPPAPLIRHIHETIFHL